jgi:hypothetical protein
MSLTASVTHPDYPGERLIACRNPELAKLRAHKRQELLAASPPVLLRTRSFVRVHSEQVLLADEQDQRPSIRAFLFGRSSANAVGRRA